MEDEHVAEALPREQGLLSRAARRVTEWTGSWWTGAGVVTAVVVWLVVGGLSGFPRGWELAVTSGVPLVTLALLVVIQHTQNHDDRAINLKLDELIRAVEGSSNSVMRVEEGSWEELEELRARFRDHSDG